MVLELALLLQDGSVPVHSPLSWHILFLFPSRMYPLSQVYTAVAPMNVPLSSTRPLAMSGRTSHMLPAKQRGTRGGGEGRGGGQRKNNSSLSCKCNKDIIDFPTFLCFPLF